MSDPTPRAPHAPAPDDDPPDSRPHDRAWVVGARSRAEAEVDPVAQAAARRRARLEARLAVYARYASVVADEASAALDGSGDRVRSLAAQRQSLEEQWRELREAGEPEGGLAFDQALAGALHELDGQSAVERALRQRLAAITDGVAGGADLAPARGLLGAGAAPIAAAGAVATRGAPPEHQLRPDAPGAWHRPDAPDVLSALGGELPPDAALADADAAARAEAIGEAVAGTLGGPLGRVYPGVVSRTDPAAYGRAEARPPAPPPTRLNVRF